MSQQIVLLPGDGIGPEITAEVVKLLTCLREDHGCALEWREALIGGAAWEITGSPLPDETLASCREAQAVFLAAVGGPRFAEVPSEFRPEKGLLRLRSELGLFANLRPAAVHPALAASSTLKAEVVSGIDMLIVRELTGGIYFGQPRGIELDKGGHRRAVNTMVYDEGEIRRIAVVAFEAARRRSLRLCSIDKSNVLEVSELWRELVEEVARDYRDVELSHLLVDNAAMQLVRNPASFDVILAGNLFGDILSDIAAQLTGSIGMLPSASLNESALGLYEPVHGSAPDIAGSGTANPLASLLSVAMMLRHSLDDSVRATLVEQAVADVLQSGLRTPDIAVEEDDVVSTSAMGDAVISRLRQISPSTL